FSFEGTSRKAVFSITFASNGECSFFCLRVFAKNDGLFLFSNPIQKKACCNESVCLFMCIVIPAVYAMLDEIVIHAENGRGTWNKKSQRIRTQLALFMKGDFHADSCSRRRTSPVTDYCWRFE
ncbi:hypothetical protein, partial [Brevibacillus sp.]